MKDPHAAARRLVYILALLTTSSARAGEVQPQTLPSVQQEPAPGPTQASVAWLPPHYDRGVVLLMAAEPANVPYRLKLNHVSQFKYTNTLHVDRTYVDHLGNERTVLRRNDIQLTRDVFYFSGYVFDRRLDFNILLYTSSATLSATAAGYVGWVFHQSFALRAGFFSLPSLRSMTGTYPFFQGTDRSMFVNYMRPGFTQGVWAEGEPLAGLHYIAMVGNSMNTLDIAAVKLDNKFVYGATVWYDLNDFDRAWNDYEHHERPALRIGTAFTYGQEDRLSDLSTASPENNATFISDGRLLFEAGALAPGVTVDLATIHLWAADVGVKYRGLAFNAEVALRWLTDFRASGELPLRSIFDWGFEASLGYFVVPRWLDAYARASFVEGSFVRSYEEGGGLNFYPAPTRQVWLNLEVMEVHRSPYGGVLYAYSAGQTGTIVQSQLLLRF